MKLWLMMLLCANTTILYCVNSFDPIDPVAMQAVHGIQRYIPLVGPGVTTSQGIMADKLNYSASASAGLFVINTSGYYYLSDDLLVNQIVTNSNPVILINASNVVLDLATKTITVPIPGASTNTVTAAIQIADGLNNVTIKNGVISNIRSTAAATGEGILINSGGSSTLISSHIVLDSLTVFGCGHFGINASFCKDLQLNNVQCIGNGPGFDGATTSGFAGGVILSNITSGTITESSFSNNVWNTAITPATAILFVGLYMTTCSNIVIKNCIASGNTNNISGTSAGWGAGVYFNATSNCTITNLIASGNIASSTNASATSGTGYGIRLNNSTSNKFDSCVFSNNQGINLGIGVELTGVAITTTSKGNEFSNCISDLNSATVPLAGTTGKSFGYRCLISAFNKFINCRADGNFVPGDATNTTIRTAVGFFSNRGFSNTFFQCQANYNNISTSHGAGAARSSVAFAAGYQLGDTGSAGTVDIETSSVLRECVSNGNFTTGTTTSAPVYGIVVLPNNGGAGQTASISINNIIEWCKVTYNLSQNSTAGFSYGIADLTFGANSAGAGVTGATTLMRYNFSVGHGSSLNGTNPNTPFTSFNMNYYLDYRVANVTSRLGNVIVENNISNLTASAIHDINNYDILNVGLLNP